MVSGWGRRVLCPGSGVGVETMGACPDRDGFHSVASDRSMMVDAYASRACPCVSAALVSLSCLEPLDMRGLNELGERVRIQLLYVV